MTTPVQTISSQAQIYIAYQDLSGADAQDQRTAVDFLSQQPKSRHFELDQIPLLRLSLLKLATRRHVLLLTLPALCADSVGLENFLREIALAYAECSNEGIQNEDVMQYADISEWQNGFLESEDAAIGGEYWEQQKELYEHEERLPYERKPEYSTFVPQSFMMALDEEMVTKIRVFVQSRESSLSTLFLSCWQVLLWHLCGNESIVVGTRCDGRNYEGLKEALGLFARYLPIPTLLQKNQRFCDVMKQVEQSVYDSGEWQEYFAWEHLVEPGGNAEQSRFFPFCYEFQEQTGVYAADDVHFSFDKLYACIDRFKVKLFAIQIDNGLMLDFGYDSQLFGREDIERLATEFCTLLSSALDHPEGAIGTLELLSSRERTQLLAEFNNTRVAYPEEACIHKLFAAQVARMPANLAVVYKDRSLTYRELNTRANQVARYLQGLGVGPEMPVGICLERSPDVVVAILGILKAGGAYVPLDPSYPRERQASMLTNAHATVLLTQDELRDHLPTQNMHIICLDSDWQAIANESGEDVPDAAGLDNLAYIMYTSGSTGQPKGVMIEHRSLANYMRWVVESLFAEAIHHLPMVTRLSFDASLKQIFAPLLCGDTVHLLDDDVVTHPGKLLQALSAHRRVALNCVPALWDALLDSMQAYPTLLRPDGITDLFVGGEALKPDLVAKSLMALPHLRIYNLYGPTETTANASCQRITSQNTISIGLPIANTQIHLLNASLCMVPIGVPGEIYIGGKGVARGYMKNPVLTAERFIPDPFSAEPGARLYRTGDLARRRPDGTIEYLGRLDTQVKIRGFRIEPGEIEMVLCQHPAVRAAVVTTREDRSEQRSLVACIVAREKHSLIIQQLSDYLRTQLPHYMLPSSFIVLETLPLMPNGKIDYRALSALEKAYKLDREEDYVAPQTSVEKTLAAIWVEALAVERVGIHDNFFALGGNSLLIVKITARIREAFQIDLPLRALLEANTVSELACIVSRELV
jgi:amino acid adenylation domain-containing protein